MSGGFALAAWFNRVIAEHQRAREITTCVNEALDAIGVGDADGFRKALTPIHISELSDDEAGRLLKAAIDHGDAKTFAAVLAFVGDPNATITEKIAIAAPQTGAVAIHTPLLSYALRVRSHDISLALAKDPRTNVGGLGWSLVKEVAMSDVAAVLAQRTAELRREEATHWDTLAAKLSPPPEAK
jgi:hypothetical protein